MSVQTKNATKETPTLNVLLPVKIDGALPPFCFCVHVKSHLFLFFVDIGLTSGFPHRKCKIKEK